MVFGAATALEIPALLFLNIIPELFRGKLLKSKGCSDANMSAYSRYTYIISGPVSWKLVSRLTARDATICIHQCSEKITVGETRLTVEAIAAGTLKMTLMIAFKFSIMNVVAIRLDTNLKQGGLCHESWKI